MKLTLNTWHSGNTLHSRRTGNQEPLLQNLKSNLPPLKGHSSQFFSPLDSVHFGNTSNRTPEQLKLFLSVQKAIQSNANLNKPFEHPLFTLLTLSVRLQDLETVQLLLSAQANPNEKTTGSPIIANATPPASNNFADTPVHVAARLGSVPILKALQASGGDVHAKGAAQKTPLHVAASEGKKEAVEWLLTQEGVSKDALDAEGNSPQALAMAKKHWDTWQLLSNNPANNPANTQIPDTGSSGPETLQNPPHDWGGLPVDD
ncbi:MAG: ankyrin repeat domain-containing protein, partial [Cyanobacteria bacterium]|nr:ankyrin repeat domain-containing protein [Cyanobacteriota bacterium]